VKINGGDRILRGWQEQDELLVMTLGTNTSYLYTFNPAVLHSHMAYEKSSPQPSADTSGDPIPTDGLYVITRLVTTPNYEASR